MSGDGDFAMNEPENTALKAMRDEAKRIGLDKLTMEEIDAEIAAYRREKAAQPGTGR